jgi:CheY-like chemotaxis protein
MPVMDGRQSAAAIRKYEETLEATNASPSPNKRINGRIPIVAVSASLDQAQRSQLAVDFDGWMLKPIDFKRMLHILTGLGDSKRRAEDGFIPGQWERGGWLINVE